MFFASLGTWQPILYSRQDSNLQPLRSRRSIQPLECCYLKNKKARPFLWPGYTSSADISAKIFIEPRSLVCIWIQYWRTKTKVVFKACITTINGSLKKLNCSLVLIWCYLFHLLHFVCHQMQLVFDCTRCLKFIFFFSARHCISRTSVRRNDV